MSSVRLGKMSLTNFRSHRNTEVTFPAAGMTLIRGYNRDTGGSSYSGKSSLELAIRYVLDAGFPYALKDQRSWQATGPTSVSLTLLKDDKTYEVTRGSTYSFLHPDGKRATGLEAVRSELRTLFGIDLHLLGLLISKKGSGKRDRFLWQSPGEKRDFLAKVIPGLTDLERLGKESAEKAKALRERVLVTSFAVTRWTDAVNGAKVSELEVVDPGPIQERVEKQNEHVLACQKDLEAAKELAQRVGTAGNTKLRAQREEHKRSEEAMERDVAKVVEPPDLAKAREHCEKRIAQLEARDQVRRGEYLDEQYKLKLSIASLRRSISSEEAVRVQIVKVEAQLEELGKKKCYTCLQPLPAEATQEREGELKNLLAGLHREIEEIQTTRERLQALENELASLSWAPNPLLEGLREALEGVRGAIRTAVASAEQKRFKDLQALAEFRRTAVDIQDGIWAQTRKELDAAEAAVRTAITQLSLAQADLQQQKFVLETTLKENARREKEIQAQQKALEEARGNLAAAVAEKTAAQTAEAAEKDLQELVKGFLTAIFDEILQEVTQKTNQILAGVANAAHVSIQFSSQTVSKTTGDAKQQISTTVTIGGYTADLESGASDGMLSAIDLAVDRALALVVAARSNCHPGWVFLDETWENLDQVSKESCMEMLREQSKDTLVLAIDHSTETKELFGQTIDVVFQNGISTIEAQT